LLGTLEEKSSASYLFTVPYLDVIELMSARKASFWSGSSNFAEKTVYKYRTTSEEIRDFGLCMRGKC